MGGACGGMRRVQRRMATPNLASTQFAFEQGIPCSPADFRASSTSLLYPSCSSWSSCTSTLQGASACATSGGSQSLGPLYSAMLAGAPAVDGPLLRQLSPQLPHFSPLYQPSVSSQQMLLQGNAPARPSQSLPAGPGGLGLVQLHSFRGPLQHEPAGQPSSSLGQQSGDRGDPAPSGAAYAPRPPSQPQQGRPRPNGRPSQLAAPTPTPSPMQATPTPSPLQAAPPPGLMLNASSGSLMWNWADTAELTGSAELPCGGELAGGADCTGSAASPRFTPAALAHLPGGTPGLTSTQMRGSTVSFSEGVEYWSASDGEEEDFPEVSETSPAAPQQQPCAEGSALATLSNPLQRSHGESPAGHALAHDRAPVQFPAVQGRLRPARETDAAPGARPGRRFRLRIRIKYSRPTEQAGARQSE
eukprot:TRINITY_DN15065_c1_g1_i1.p1 TRINITY_DN15065_c1_g1~~TRINITY_DN15065_c1_g1_i1.p1  ORF type:complete len:446 (+),score=92.50 TRINITY_DN15065_c1_g1_i1:91-1338(+)